MSAATSLERINKFKKVAIAVLIVYLVIYYGLLFLFKHDYAAIIASDLMSPVGIISSLLIMVYVLQFLSSKKIKQIWIVFILGAAFYLMGDLLLGYGEIIEGSSPFASTSDIWYTVSAFLILVGFFLHIPQKSRFSLARSGFDVLIVMVIYLSLDFKYIVLPVMDNIVITGTEKLAALAYPLFDAGLFMAILLIYYNDANDKNYFKSKIMLAITVIWFVADQLFSMQSIIGLYQSGSWLDPLWPASFIGLSIVALQSAEFHLFIPESLDNTDEDISEGLNKRGFFTYGAMIIFMVMWCFQYYDQDPLSIGGIIVIFLLILRQYFALLENRRLLQLLIKSNEDLQEAKSRIEYELRTDYLTRLFNRRYIDGAVAEMQNSVENRSAFSVLVLDIDHFKKVNDQYGHITGDLVLQQIAQIICMNIRKGDIAARWGGEEFIVLLPDTGETLAYTIGERIRSEIERNNFKSDKGLQNIQLSVSIGISEVNSYEQDFYNVLLRADQGMYEAKDAGRNRTVIKRIS